MGSKTSKTTQVTEYPEFVTKYGEEVYPIAAQAAKDLPTAFEPYTGNRVAGFNQDQLMGFQQLRDLVARMPDVGPEALEFARSAAAAPAQSISTERVVDEGGRLGALSDYIDPFMKAAEGPVQSAIRKITEAADATRKRLGAGATMADAYGDARHGIVEAENEKNRNLAIGETAGNLYAKAFADAMAMRTADRDRFAATDLANAQFAETELGRRARGATDLVNTAAADQQRQLQQISSLLEIGGKQQANEQLGLDRAFEEFLREYSHPFNVLAALTGAAKGTPVESTTTQTQPNNAGWGALGSLAGALLSPVQAGGTTALGSLLALSDERVKEDIAPVGTLHDGQIIYRFRYQGDPSGRTHIGLMAQEVEENVPEAVVEIGGLKLVDYDKATRPAFAALSEDALRAA